MVWRTESFSNEMKARQTLNNLPPELIDRILSHVIAEVPYYDCNKVIAPFTLISKSWSRIVQRHLLRDLLVGTPAQVNLITSGSSDGPSQEARCFARSLSVHFRSMSHASTEVTAEHITRHEWLSFNDFCKIIKVLPRLESLLLFYPTFNSLKHVSDPPLRLDTVSQLEIWTGEAEVEFVRTLIEMAPNLNSLTIHAWSPSTGKVGISRPQDEVTFSYFRRLFLLGAYTAADLIEQTLFSEAELQQITFLYLVVPGDSNKPHEHDNTTEARLLVMLAPHLEELILQYDYVDYERTPDLIGDFIHLRKLAYSVLPCNSKELLIKLPKSVHTLILYDDEGLLQMIQHYIDAIRIDAKMTKPELKVIEFMEPMLKSDEGVVRGMLETVGISLKCSIE